MIKYIKNNEKKFDFLTNDLNFEKVIINFDAKISPSY